MGQILSTKSGEEKQEEKKEKGGFLSMVSFVSISTLIFVFMIYFFLR